MQTPKVWGECGTYRLTRSARAHSRPEGPQSQERNRHVWSLGRGVAPQMPDFFFYSFFLSLVFCFSISSDANFFLFLFFFFFLFFLFFFVLFFCVWLLLSSYF